MHNGIYKLSDTWRLSVEWDIKFDRKHVIRAAEYTHILDVS